jgi:ribosome recycling factor
MIAELKTQISKAISHLKSEFTTLQTGRANASLVDELMIDSYGSMMPLKQLANISCPDAKTIRVEPWDKNFVKEIEKAITIADIGINPQNMGDSIFLPIPPMTEDRRKSMVKLVHELSEKAKISIRSARQDSMKLAKMQEDEGALSEDQLKDLESDIQENVDSANKEIDQLSKKKEQEVLTV